MFFLDRLVFPESDTPVCHQEIQTCSQYPWRSVEGREEYLGTHGLLQQVTYSLILLPPPKLSWPLFPMPDPGWLSLPRKANFRLLSKWGKNYSDSVGWGRWSEEGVCSSFYHRFPMPAPYSALELNLGSVIPEPLKDTFLLSDLLLCGLTHRLRPECLNNHNSCLSSPAPSILQIFLSFLILFVIMGLCLLQYSFIVICVQHAMFSQKSFLSFPACKVF